MKKMNHPSIIKFKDAFIEKGKLYIVTDFAIEGDLQDMINKKRQRGFYIKEKMIWIIAKQISEGI